jgi:hypothetical protein
MHAMTARCADLARKLDALEKKYDARLPSLPRFGIARACSSHHKHSIDAQISRRR